MHVAPLIELMQLKNFYCHFNNSHNCFDDTEKASSLCRAKPSISTLGGRFWLIHGKPFVDSKHSPHSSLSREDKRKIHESVDERILIARGENISVFGDIIIIIIVVWCSHSSEIKVEFELINQRRLASWGLFLNERSKEQKRNSRRFYLNEICDQNL